MPPMHLGVRKPWLYDLCYARTDALENMTLFRELPSQHELPGFKP